MMNDTTAELEYFQEIKQELTYYCYRMLGSMEDADDAVQETHIRVWQHRSSFRGEASFKTWVYRIASNLCLDKLRQAKRRIRPVDHFDPAADIVEPRDTLPPSQWVWPAPDLAENPEDRMIRKDTLQICFIALLQVLPPRQRAVWIFKDVFEWPTKHIAEALDMSPAAVNSALQRARAALDQEQLRSDEYARTGMEPDQELLNRYVDAFEQFDIDTLVALFHEEGRMSMPPFNMWIKGREDLRQFFSLTRWHCEGSRFIRTTANGGVPVLAQYVPGRIPDVLVPWGIHMLEVREGHIDHVQNFIHTPLFRIFGLPLEIQR
ncbi:sigma-70 family RNA polymerase sigma factor [Paenibacillus algicola]|nr:sigma-70 family RNA polymerase sigma factor [Paenibacillus algicola]